MDPNRVTYRAAVERLDALARSGGPAALADVAEELQISSSQTYALVRSGELPAIQIGGRGQWRVEQAMLEKYIQDKYAETRRLVEEAKSGRGS